MNPRIGQNGALQNPILNSMVYSWDYFDMSFPENHHFSSTQTYVPNGFIELIFLKHLHVYEALGDEPPKALPQSFVWGQTKQGNRVVVVGSGTWFEIKLFPWAFELLFGHSALSLPSGGTALRDINQDFDVLSENINEATTSADAIQIFEQFALQRLHSPGAVQPFLLYAFDQMLGSHGQVQISALCQKMNISRQYFHQYFKDKIGLSPKYYGKIIRLRHAVDLIYKHRDKSQTQIALQSGYFDQAHFINDFRAILGQTPTAFFEQRQFIYWDLY